ncbi:FAD-dependent monooxygenase [Nocardia sp. NBC_00416]|uniref:FAD-dependent monooxygenase n=1 Tax=Nocardia sp. NBC_00416 TaxID=2975991 RepID=UPI002E223D91
MADTEVIIVGAGPAGLMLAAELRLAGIRPLVLERHPEHRDTHKANGLGGQILELLRYRGLLERLEAAATGPSHPAPRYPFGDVHLDFSGLAEPPLRGLTLPQPQLERLLAEHAGELGAEVRRGHEVVGVSQDAETVTAQVRGPDGTYPVTAAYLVGCDGGHSRVREMAGIAFPGLTYPEVNRLGQVTLPDSVIRLDNGDLEVPGPGRIGAGFTRTDHGVFGFGPLTDEVLLVLTTETDPTEIDDEPMSLTEFQDSIRRVLGADLPLGEVIRLSRYQFQARQAERYRDGRILLAGDAAHLFPATGVGLNAGMLDTVDLAWKLAADIDGWAPAGLLDTYHEERHYAGARTLLQTQAQVALRRDEDPAARALREVFLELLVDEQPLRRLGSLIAGTDLRYPMPNPNQHPLTGTFAPDLTLRIDQRVTSVAELMPAARPVLLDLADRPELREIADEWAGRVDIRTAETDARPADALLIRPDAHIAWAATVGEPGGIAALALREALSYWFGEPVKTTVPLSDRPT